MHNVDISNPSYLLNNEAYGRVKIWQFSPETGKKECLVDKPNLVVKDGASILASALAGKAYSNITHFYVGYSSVPVNIGSLNVAVGDTVTSFPSTGTTGYLRIPLAFPPAFLQDAGYVNNIPYFTTFITNGTVWTQHGSQAFGNNVYLYSLGLVNAQDPASSSQDRLFSKVYFGPITYDSSHGLAITWGITFRANSV